MSDMSDTTERKLQKAEPVGGRQSPEQVKTILRKIRTELQRQSPEVKKAEKRQNKSSHNRPGCDVAAWTIANHNRPGCDVAAWTIANHLTHQRKIDD